MFTVEMSVTVPVKDEVKTHSMGGREGSDPQGPALYSL